MSDNTKMVGKPDRDRINLTEDYELRDWCKKFNVSQEELKQAVKKVGNLAKDVEEYFGKSR